MTALIFGSPEAVAIVNQDKELAHLIYIISGLIDAGADPMVEDDKVYLALLADQLNVDPALVALALERTEKEVA